MYFYLRRHVNVQNFGRKGIVGFTVGATLAGYGAGVLLSDFLQIPLVVNVIDRLILGIKNFKR
jgi:hypothetical protein